MAQHRLIYQFQNSDKSVEIHEKPDPLGKTIVTKATTFLSADSRNDLHALTGLLQFLSTITHPNLCKIESYQQTSTAQGPAVEVFMEPAVLNAQQHLSTAESTVWNLETDLVPQLDGLIEVLAFAQKQGRGHCRLSLDHLLITQDYGLKLIGFPPVTRGREIAHSQALDAMYLSPMRSEMQQQGRIPHGYNEYKADVYSLGICIIMIAFTGKDRHAAALRNRKIASLMDPLLEFKGLHARLTQMMQLEDSRRPDFVQLESFCKRLAVPSVPAPVQTSKPSLPFAPRLCPTCQAPLAGLSCPKCTPSTPKRTPFFTPARDDPDILSDGATVCKNCRQPFVQRYNSNHESFERQFTDFCSEACVMEKALKDSQEEQEGQ